MSLRYAFLLAAVLPFSAQAASIVPGFTEVTVGDRGTISVSLTLLGPVKGPLKVGLVNGKRLSRATDLELDSLGAGEFANIMADMRVGRTATGTHTVGIEGPKGIVARTKITIVPGPQQETLMGAKSKMMKTYLHKRDSDLRRGWIDDTGESLVAIFFLKVKDTGDAYTVDFIHKKERVCGDIVYPSAFRGQVVKVLALCKLGEAEEIESDDVVLDDDSHLYAPTPLGGDTGDINLDSGPEEKTLPLTEMVEKGGLWRVEVRKEKKLKRVLTFSVKRKKIVAGAPGRAPLKLARVKVVSP